MYELVVFESVKMSLFDNCGKSIRQVDSFLI